MKTINQTLRIFILMTIMTGVAYPLFVTLVAQISFPFKANGSFVHHKGSIVGSGLISQKFVSDIYFWPRPSAIDYNPLPSGGSNLGPISADLQAEVTERKNQLNKANPTAGNIPHDLLFASGSGLDPDISPEAARYQIDRVARARGLDAVQKSGLAALVEKCIQPRTLGIFGEPRVNVLHLNLAIDSSFAGRNP